MTVQRTDIDDFILKNVGAHTGDIVPFTAAHFGISRQRAHTYIVRLAAKGQILKTGQTRASRYFSATGKVVEFREHIRPGLAEDRVWTRSVRPSLLSLPENVYRICQYGFTEMFNNAIDHSEGTAISVRIETANERAKMTITDNGVGIFSKIQRSLHLDSVRESILHLAKGKFTTNPAHHTGEGIFFSSRVFDDFSLHSDGMCYVFKDEDWLKSPERREDSGRGTMVQMSIAIRSQRTIKETMDRYADAEIGFGKTIVAVRLSAEANDPHVSRSQAKRLMAGLERFRHVVLDFNGIETVGQAFIDEIFRVFRREHPSIRVDAVRAVPEVEAMIRRAQTANGA